jgi:hypothetical protein
MTAAVHAAGSITPQRVLFTMSIAGESDVALEMVTVPDWRTPETVVVSVWATGDSYRTYRGREAYKALPPPY